MHIDRTIGSRLKEMRKRRRWSIPVLARRAELVESTVYRIEEDERRNPRADTLQALANALEISVSELIGEEPDEAPPKPVLSTIPIVADATQPAQGDNVLDHWRFGSDSADVQIGEDVIGVRVTDEMSGGMFLAGDLVLLNLSGRIRGQGEAAMALIEDKPCLLTAMQVGTGFIGAPVHRAGELIPLTERAIIGTVMALWRVYEPV